METMDPVEKFLFVEGIYQKYGYDFRQYSEASFERRLASAMGKFGMDTIFDLLKYAFKSKDHFQNLLPQLTVTTTEFFRDPSFFKSLRDHVIPVLRTYPTIKVWTAGCSTGQEVLSLSILFREEGLENRTTFYATDINPDVIENAKNAIYSIDQAPIFTKNYIASGGTKAPSDYYHAEYGLIRMDPSLLENVVFSEHNLVTDNVFQECHLVICRNVLIYFTRPVQDRIFELFSRSLVSRGFLAIGSKESLSLSDCRILFDGVDSKENVFRLKLGIERRP